MTPEEETKAQQRFLVLNLVRISGAIMLVLGLFTRPVAFLLAGEMAVGYWMAHAPKSIYPSINMGDAAILFCFVFLYIAAAGPGPWSIDSSRTPRRLVGD